MPYLAFRVTSPKTPGAPTTSPSSRASVPLLMQKNLWDGFGEGIPDPGKRRPSCYLAHLQIAAPRPREGSRSFLGRGASRTNHWGSFLSCLREPNVGHPFGSSFSGQDPEPSRGATRSLPVSSGRSSRQAQQLSGEGTGRLGSSGAQPTPPPRPLPALVVGRA